jgi:hypothetical protein
MFDIFHNKIFLKVGHGGNPRYLGGRDRRITSLRPAWAKLVTPHLKNKTEIKKN